MAATTTLVQLLQLSVEYLLQVQESLLTEQQDEAIIRKRTQERVKSLEEQLRQVSAERDLAQTQLRHFRALAHAATDTVRFFGKESTNSRNILQEEDWDCISSENCSDEDELAHQVDASSAQRGALEEREEAKAQHSSLI
uniref:Cilium assembly protein DZIP1 N-terminal domain-containing protein n=2 Tax=Aureoumbra lagunensis TaxID=44058 RepID=A0A7S3JSI5_9STRA|mmetsp:Transcript_4063/g.5699  ORF Transcript_4063/g.5699 Transcript_4063/m.5699 type:complete len:140 (+) Transcript_4063:410-829(+)